MKEKGPTTPTVIDPEGTGHAADVDAGVIHRGRPENQAGAPGYSCSLL